MSHTVEITTVPSRTVAVAHFHVDSDELGAMGAKMGAAFGAVMAHLGRSGVSPEGPAVACYEPDGGGGFEVAAGFAVRGPFEPGGDVAPLALPAGEVAHLTHLGAYDELPAAYEELRSGVEAQGRALARDVPMWEEYWSGPGTPPEQIRTEVFWPVTAG